MNFNPFRYCTWLKSIGYVMILLVLAIIGVSYSAVVVLGWAPRLHRGGAETYLSVLIIVGFHVLLVMLTWSYFMVVFQDPGSVPENWSPVLEDNLEESTSISESGYVVPEVSASVMPSERPVRYCNRCQNGKPPRCHHCSVCQRCVLKMDHHCVWVVNCVGARNYKFFLLFLLYTFLETTLDAVVLLPSIIELLGEAKKHNVSPGSLAVAVLAFVLNLAFSLSLLCFLVMHASLLSSNTTTIEVYEKKREKERAAKWKYDLGWKKNFEQVFGTKSALWLLPMFSKDDINNPALQGVYFPVRDDIEP